VKSQFKFTLFFNSQITLIMRLTTNIKYPLTKEEIMRYSLLASAKSDVGIRNPAVIIATCTRRERVF